MEIEGKYIWRYTSYSEWHFNNEGLKDEESLWEVD